MALLRPRIWLMQKTIYIYSPSGAVRQRAAYRVGIRRLEQAGYGVVQDPAVLTTWQRFAGDDAERLAAIARATQSGADMALISRGGYGLTRLLPQLDYAAIGASIELGLAWMGFSDFTALQLALIAQNGVGTRSVTWAGLGLLDDVAGLRCPDQLPDDISMACLDDVLQAYSEGAGWRMTAAHHRSWLASGAEPELALQDAPLWGGNLAVLCSLLGTPYFPVTDDAQQGVAGGILFLEDVAEHPYRLERMLTQLLYSGVLHSQRALILGGFSDYKLSPHDKGYKLASVVAWLRSQLDIPVLEGLPFGHVATKVCLPVGWRVDLQVQGKEVLLLWPTPPHRGAAHTHGPGCGCSHHTGASA